MLGVERDEGLLPTPEAFIRYLDIAVLLSSSNWTNIPRTAGQHIDTENTAVGNEVLRFWS